MSDFRVRNVPFNEIDLARSVCEMNTIEVKSECYKAFGLNKEIMDKYYDVVRNMENMYELSKHNVIYDKDIRSSKQIRFIFDNYMFFGNILYNKNIYN